jgi:hypothetical protein
MEKDREEREKLNRERFPPEEDPVERESDVVDDLEVRINTDLSRRYLQSQKQERPTVGSVNTTQNSFGLREGDGRTKSYSRLQTPLASEGLPHKIRHEFQRQLEFLRTPLEPFFKLDSAPGLNKDIHLKEDILDHLGR